MNALVLVKTNRGAAWILPQVKVMMDSGITVTVAVPPGQGDLTSKLDVMGISVIRSPTLTRFGLLHTVNPFKRFSHRVEFQAFDILIYHLYRSALVGRFIGWKLRKPTIHVVPGPLFLESPIVRFLERFLHRFDTCIVATSSATEKIYRQLGVSHQKIKLIPYGVDLERRRPATFEQKHDARVKLSIAANELVFVQIAYWYGSKVLVPRSNDIKGHVALLTAWTKYKRDGGRGVLLLVGSGFDKKGDAERLRQEKKHKSLASVRFIGSVADVQDYYHCADISVSPSKSENLGAAAEACAYGVPTLATRVGGLPDLVIDGVTGWLTPSLNPSDLASSLHRASNEQDLQSLQMASREIAEHKLNLAQCTENFVKCVRQVLSTYNKSSI